MGDSQIMRRAVFLDRDGVLNKLVFNPDTKAYEPPHTVSEIKLYPYTITSLLKLQSAGYDLFVVSNQPDYAKGKVSFESLMKIHEKFLSIISSEGIVIHDFYYCYHHPSGIVKEYSFVCECRKPKPYFLLKAQQDHLINLTTSWMIGDRDTDILCGQAAGVRTILINEPNSADKRGDSHPDFIVNNLLEATKLIFTQSD
jgi:D-glycero-D-manno-heptose 1,7-bisphosphate phosphatase